MCDKITVYDMPCSCPYCQSQHLHILATDETFLFDHHFRQGCRAAFVVQCEEDPIHLFHIIIGQHKGQVLIEVVTP